METIVTDASKGYGCLAGLVVCSGFNSGTLIEWFEVDLGLAEVGQHRVDHLEGLVDLLTNFGSSENDLARNEDEKHLRDVSKEKEHIVTVEASHARSWASSFCR